jgi:glycosyltransferase involved in cell wall biosynthesis
VVRAARLAVVRDFRAELWPSMDLCADQLLGHLPATVVAEDVAPAFRRVLGHLPFLSRAGFNADRLLNRHLLLPRIVRRTAGRADFVHVVDHSYAHLVRSLPPGRAGVYCHDLDAFRSLLEPEKERRPWWFRKLARRTLDGLKRAAVVFHSTLAVGRRLRDDGIVPAEHLVYAPYGVADEFVPDAPPVALPVPLDSPFVLHVGGNIPRKRLDVLLDVFAAVRAGAPGLRLVQVGGPWPPQLAEQIEQLGIGPAVSQLRGLSRVQLAELYRRAAVVLVPSEAEGFGLPVIEALACGAPVVASDIPTLREAGGDAALYRPVADVPAWADAVARLLRDPASAPPRELRLAHAARFSWREHARVIAKAYLALASGGRKPPES